MKIDKYKRKKCLYKQYGNNNFCKREKETCVNISGMNAMFDIPHNFRLSVKFSIHMINNAINKHSI